MKKEVIISDRNFVYDTCWDNQKLEGPIIAFDCETEAILENSPYYIPQLALASCSNGKEHYLIHPSKIAAFIDLHHDFHFVFHNIAFDFWVIDKYLRDRSKTTTLSYWWEAAEGRFHDTMLLDMLYGLALNDAYPKPRDLAVVSKKYAEMDISKEDPYRIRYGEIIGKDWNTIDPGFLEYAIKDPIATYFAFVSLFKACKEKARKCGISKDVIEKYGLFTETIQIKGALSLSKVTANGFRVNSKYAIESIGIFKKEINDVVESFLQQDKYKNLFQRHKKTKQLLYTATGLPRKSLKELRTILLEISQETEKETGKKLKIPLSEKTKNVGTSMKDWSDLLPKHPFIEQFSKMEELAKLCQFLRQLQQDRVYPKYSILKRTGRTSCYSPNVQQLHRGSGIRECFEADDGYLLCFADYAFIELRCLAHIMETMYGKSLMADVIREGLDLHAYTGAMFNKVSYEEFMSWKETRPDKYDKDRQSAKACIFGISGGLGAATLKTYAHMVYKVEFTEEEAKDFRNKLIYEVYPELGNYLSEDTMLILANNLGCPVGECWQAFDWKGDRNQASAGSIRKIVAGNKLKKDGTPYNERYYESIWYKLNYLNKNASITPLLRNRQTEDDILVKQLFWDQVQTLTGRVRGRVSFCQAKNTPFQSLAADGAKLALWALTKKNLHISAFVHDEIIFQIKDRGGWVSLTEIKQIVDIMCKEMKAITGRVPIEGDFTVCKKWKKKAKIKIEGDRVYPIS